MVKDNLNEIYRFENSDNFCCAFLLHINYLGILNNVLHYLLTY